MTMVTKFVILPLIFACCFLAGCSVSSSEKTVTSPETETVTEHEIKLPPVAYSKQGS